MINGKKLGIVILNFEQDLYNPISDNTDLMICDYYDVPLKYEHMLPDIEYKGKPVVKVGGSKKRFSIDAVNGHWNVKVSDNLSPNILVTESNNEIWIKVKDDIKMTGEKIILSYIDNDNVNNFSVIEVEVIS